MTYTNPLYRPSFEKLFYPNQGGRGHGLLCPYIVMPVTVVQPSGFVNGVPKRGSEATERGEGVSFPPPTVGRFSCTLHVDTIIRGSLCTGIDHFPTLFLFIILFLMNLSFFPFPFSFFFLLFPPFFCQLIGGGGGARAPPPPRSYATVHVISVRLIWFCTE